jgi:hypothetical protein
LASHQSWRLNYASRVEYTEKRASYCSKHLLFPSFPLSIPRKQPRKFALMIGKSGDHGWCIAMGGVLPAEIEVPDKKGDGMFKVFPLFVVTDGAMGQPPDKCPQ